MVGVLMRENDDVDRLIIEAERIEQRAEARLARAAVDNHLARAIRDVVRVALANVDYKAVGLADFGKPDNFLERQVDRWESQLNSYGKLYNYPGRDLPGYAYARDWLRANVPEGFKAGIIHGDVGTPNALFADGPPARLTALIDWELSTIGDPLLDLAWLCNGLRSFLEHNEATA